MKPTQNLSDFFSNNAQGSGGSPGTSLSGFFDSQAKPKAAAAPQGRASDVSAIVAQEGADHLKPVIEAIYKQESGAGANARTSIDGAQGGMQVIPATFQRYAKPGERIDNPDDNMRVGVRIIKDLARRFGNDPAKIATGYFSGEGNVNPGQGSAWKNDLADGNGKRVSGYVADILAKVGGISEAQAALPAASKPDLKKAPKWADIAGKPEFTSLPPEKQAEAKGAYFDYYIAPHAGQQAAALRQQFMQAPTGAPERTWGEAATDTGVQLAEGVNTILGAIPNLVSPEGDVAGFFNDNAKFWRDKQSKALQSKIANADKAITKAGEDGVISQIAEAASQYFTDPALAARFVTTNLPSMIPGIGAAKLAQAAALAKGASAARAAQIATTAAGATNAALNAGGARGEAFEDIKRTLIQQGMSPEQAEQQALADSRIVAAVGGIAGYVSGKTGLEKSLFGQATTKGAIKSGVAATATELAGEQLEEVAPKITTNIQAGQYDNRSVGQDVGRTIVETAIGSGPGALVAGGASAMQKAPETATVTPDGRIEPTMGGETPVQAAEPAPVDVHPTVQAADAIVRDLATEANIPLETVLPTQPQPTTGPELVSDQDVQAFADGRYQQLRAKRDGQIETTVGESGIVDQDVPGAGLTAAEQQELAGLEQARGDVVTLRTLYGIDQPVPSDQSQLAAQGNEAVPEAAPVAQPTPGQQFTATTETGLLAAQEGQSENGQDPQLGAAQYQDAGNGIAAEQRAAPVAEPASDPAIAQAPAVDAAPAQQVQPETAVTESEANREARLEREAIQAEGEPMPETPRQYADIPFPDDSASPATTAANPFEDAAPAKPRTEKEARAQRDYAGKWFGSQEKAEQFIAKQGIGATHVAVQDGKKFLIQKKEISNASQADQAQQAEAQESERQQAQSAPEVGRYALEASGAYRDGSSWSKKYRTVKRNDGVFMLVRELADEDGTRTEYLDQNGDWIKGEPSSISVTGVSQISGAETFTSEDAAISWAEDDAGPSAQRIAKNNAKTTKTPSGKPKTAESQRDNQDRRSKNAQVSEGQSLKNDPFAGNKIFTADKIEAARARLKSKLGTLNSGIDPELLVDGMTIAGGYIESGVRRYSDYTRAMVSDFGEKIRPYLRSFYEAARNYPGLDTAGMTTAAEINLMEKQGTAEHTKTAAGAEAGPVVMATANEAAPIPEAERLSEAQFAQVIEERIGQFRHQPPILIRDSVIDVPHMRQARAGSAAGVTTGGKIYLFRDANATIADVVRTLWHELVHYGLRRFLTKEQYIAQMQKLYDRDLWVRKRAEEWLATDGDDVKQARKAGEAYARARGVDEALAELSETNEGEYRNNTLKAKAIRQAARWIAAVAERFGFNEFAAKYRAVTNDEARALVRSMFQKLREDAPATSSDWAFTADPAFMVRRIQNNLIQFFGNRNETLKTFGKYDKTLSTQYNKALKDKNYGKVFAYVNAMQNEVSLTSIRPAELAPGVLPRVDDVKSALRGLVKGKHADKNLTQAADAIFAGTLNGPNVMAGKVWSDDELRGKFGLTDTGIALYRQARAAIDASLDEVAASEAYAMAQGIVPKALRRSIIDSPRLAESLLVGELQKQIKLLDMAIKNAKRQGNEQQQSEYEAIRAQYADTKRKVEKIFVTGKNLKLAGYAPLMRFGKWTVTVQQIDPTTGNVLRDDEGKPLTEYFGKFETEGEAISVRHQMEAKYKDRDDIKVKAGVDSQAAHELYAGISPETIALFGEAVGADEVTRKYYQMALSERSALKRRLERKGTAGYSEDLPRVLSNFITSNGRFAAQRYYLRDLNNAIKYIPQEKGDVKDEAMRLKQFVMNPNDPAAPVSSVMFAWFLGGSVAAALVNMTQPVMMTGPYLSQHGVTTASKALAKAIPYAMGKKEITDAELKVALKRASQEGIVDAQEIFHLYSVGAQGVASGLVNTLARLPGVGGTIKAGSEDARARINAFLTLWGSMFSLAEGFNRKLTFVAAWEVAKANKEANPYAFAVRAVNETQGIYNKVNRPNWAQGKVGRVILTFKQFSLMYIELLSRMWKRGGPEGKRAALIMLAMLMLASGEEGLPFAQDLDDLIDTIGQMFGLDTNMRRNKRRLAHEILGKTLGDLFLYGVSAQLPIDLSGRLGLGNMIPGTGVLKPSDEQMRGRNVAEIFGPTAGMATQIGDAYDAATEGNPGKALQNLAPKAIKDLMAAAEMAKKGYATDAKGRKVVDVGLEDVASKAVGFNPTKVAQQHRKTMPIQQDIALQKRTETAIVDQWARGVADDDEEMVDAAIKRRDDWNRLNPRTPIVIRGTQIRDRVRQMATEKDDRLLRQAPKEMRGAIGLDLVDSE